jgi:hypothetical protein
VIDPPETLVVLFSFESRPTSFRRQSATDVKYHGAVAAARQRKGDAVFKSGLKVVKSVIVVCQICLLVVWKSSFSQVRHLPGQSVSICVRGRVSAPHYRLLGPPESAESSEWGTRVVGQFNFTSACAERKPIVAAVSMWVYAHEINAGWAQ